MIKKLFSSILNVLPQQKGLSLLEVAIGIAVLGLIALPIIRSYSNSLEKKAYNNTLGNLQEATDGINQYFFSGNSSYPCPSDLSLAEGDVNFGLEGNCTLGSIVLCSSPTWLTNGGICKTDNTANAIIIGGLPFGALKMSQKSSLDYWGNKLIYAITLSQTNQATYLPAGGKIQVKAVDNPENVVDGTEDGNPDILPNLYDMFLFSTGRTATGGYTGGGMKISACGNSSSGFEHENCDNDDIFFALEDPSDRDSSAFSRVFGVNFFDDITNMQISPPLATWFQHTDNPIYLNKDYVITLATKVGIGTSNPDLDVSLHVVGDIRAEVVSGSGGRIKSDLICDETGTCFNPEIITSNISDMNCDPDASFPLKRGVTRISNSKVTCNTALREDPANLGTFIPIGNGDNLKVDNSKFGVKDCSATGMIAAGIDASGDLICIIP